MLAADADDFGDICGVDGMRGDRFTPVAVVLAVGGDEDIQPDATYRMSGNRIGATTLDLDRPFEEIRAQLDGIAESLTGPSTPAS